MRHSEGGHPTKGKVEPMCKNPQKRICNSRASVYVIPPEYHLHKTPNEEIRYLTRLYFILGDKGSFA